MCGCRDHYLLLHSARRLGFAAYQAMSKQRRIDAPPGLQRFVDGERVDDLESVTVSESEPETYQLKKPGSLTKGLHPTRPELYFKQPKVDVLKLKDPQVINQPRVVNFDNM